MEILILSIFLAIKLILGRSNEGLFFYFMKMESWKCLLYGQKGPLRVKMGYKDYAFGAFASEFSQRDGIWLQVVDS